MDPLAVADGSIWGILAAGLLLGLVEGLLPGPLMMVVISETMKHDWKAGAKVSASVLITDGPIIIVCALAWHILRAFESLLSTAAAMLLLWLAWKAWSSKPPLISRGEEKDHSLRHGIMTNIVNPNPYRFWGLIGAPFLLAASELGMLVPLLFILGFFSMFIVCKVSIARIVDRSRDALQSRGYLLVMRGCSLTLVGFAVGFLLRLT